MRFLLISILCSAATLGAEEFRFDGEAAWSTWKRPHGLVEFGEGGQLRLVKYRKDVDAIADAPQFSHLTRSRGENVPGGIWEAGTNSAAAGRIIDGDNTTFWQASPDDPLGDTTYDQRIAVRLIGVLAVCLRVFV